MNRGTEAYLRPPPPRLPPPKPPLRPPPPKPPLLRPPPPLPMLPPLRLPPLPPPKMLPPLRGWDGALMEGRLSPRCMLGCERSCEGAGRLSYERCWLPRSYPEFMDSSRFFRPPGWLLPLPLRCCG